MSHTEDSPITYHLLHYALSEPANSAALDTYLQGYTDAVKEDDNYVKFSSADMWEAVARKCATHLKDAFYYALVFELEGKLMTRVAPKYTDRCLIPLKEENRLDLESALSALSNLLELKSQIRLKNAK